MSFNESRSSHQSVHDKGRSMLKETSRKRFLLERKELQHEMSTHKTEILHLMNDKYEWVEDLFEKDHYTVRFRQPQSKDVVEVPFFYESNYNTLKDIWQNE